MVEKDDYGFRRGTKAAAAAELLADGGYTAKELIAINPAFFKQLRMIEARGFIIIKSAEGKYFVNRENEHVSAASSTETKVKKVEGIEETSAASSYTIENISHIENLQTSEHIIEKIDKQCYILAKRYLPSLGLNGITESLIDKYLNPLTINPKPTSKQGIYQRILESAQNANMKAGVIGGAIGGVNKLACVLDDFNSKAVLSKYGNRCDDLLDDIVKQLKPTGKIRRTQRSIWPNYCKTIISAANFVERFASGDDFFSWIDSFERQESTRESLPKLLSQEIKGFGFALSCDFLKELGYVNFPKPDTHLRKIFLPLNLCPEGADDYKLFKAIIRLANHANVSAYNADKVFWLIGSGYFYNDPHIGNNGRIGSYRHAFIEFAGPILQKIKHNIVFR